MQHTTTLETERANGPMGDVIRRFGRIAPLVMRVWGLDHGIVLPIDRTAIDFDAVAGSGLRPTAFFRLLRAVELTFADKRMPGNFSGRPFVNGIKAFLQGTQTSFVQVVVEVIKAGEDPQDMFVESIPGADATAIPGMAAAFFANFSDGWKDLDQYAQAAIGFFFEIPAPQGQTLVCGAGTILDVSTSPLSCVPDNLPPPTTLVCGPGTALVGQECVPDHQPDPVIVCGANTVLDETATPFQCVSIPTPPPVTETLCTELIVGQAMLECRQTVEVIVQ